MFRAVSLILAVVFTAFVTGCSSKESFSPEHTEPFWQANRSLPDSIVDVTYDGAQLEAGELLTREGIQSVRIPEHYRFVGRSDGRILSASIDGKLQVVSESDSNQTMMLDLKKSIAGASVSGDLLAVLFADNDMALYSLTTQLPLMKEQGSAVIAVDNRIVNPHFFNDLVLFPTLDGKVTIIHAEQKKTIRSIIISSEEHFNNVIYFKVIGSTIVAATSTTLFALSDKEVREAYDLRDVVFDNDGVWVATKQGEVVALTPSLQLKAKKKFPFAHFLGMIVTDDQIYLLEKEGYLITLSKDLSTSQVYEVDVEDGFVFVGDNAFYFDTEYVSISK